jgi:hypothetical protein
MRHRLKVAQIREMNTAFADQIAASPMRTLHVPNQCPASFDSSVQTGLLVNFVQIFSDRNLAIARRDPKSCNLAGFDIFPKQQVCYCKQ